MPALYKYVAFIYTLRCEDESVRRAFLAADENEQFDFIQRHLPYAQRACFSGIRRHDRPSKQKQVQPEAEPEAEPEQPEPPEQKQVQPEPKPEQEQEVQQHEPDSIAAPADGEAMTANAGPTVVG